MSEEIWTLGGGLPRFGVGNWAVPHERCVHEVRQGLGNAAFDATVRRGAHLSLDEAAAFALGEPDGPLTRREFQVAALITEGLSNKEIARRLGISRRTVEGHVDRILTKLGFASRVQIVSWFITHRQQTDG